MGVHVAIDRPGLTAALAARGIGTGTAVVVVPLAMLPACRAAHPAAAVLAVANDAADEAMALDAGADDAVAAAAPDVLLAARAARLLRRRAVQQVGDLAIDRFARTASRAGRAVTLLPREYALLDHLAHHVGTTVPHAQLRAAVFGLRFDPGTNVLAVQVSRLRAALDRDFEWSMLVTDRGRGYRLVAAPDAAR